MAEARTLSRNADIHTDDMDEFPPLFLNRANKQIRTNEKTRHTRLINRIKKHMAELGSRTELNFMRRNLANQLEECIRAHKIYQSSPTQRQNPEHEWVAKLEQATTKYYGRIDNYIRTAPRAPSTSSSIQSTITSFSLPSQ
ncbi:hypothetical protein GHT06_018634 [Daphnia sinensis]|uniref:Uncharacterized protein n=1 Tax=Daphnia sinensis TaxID=1820382 RepID=A0AAD5PR05_9CRUS|nr:hypothetical protein GHT06_018634 [Daphnia sinensis]